VEESWINFDQG